MLKLYSFVIPISVALLTGCVTQPPKPAVTLKPYIAADHQKYFAKGKGVIEGQAFLRQNGGGTVLCSGSSVILVPATSYFNDAIFALVGGRSVQVSEATTPMMQPVIRRTKCNAQGEFVFEEVPPGDWNVLTEVTWSVARSKQGGTLMEMVSVTGSEKKKVILSRLLSEVTGLVDGGY